MADQLLRGTTLIEDKRSSTGNVWSCKGTAFHPPTNDPTDMAMSWTGNGRFFLSANTGDVHATASVNLPNGAKVTGVIVYASGATGWNFDRITIDGTTATTMASAAEDVEDTTITNDIIDNNSFAYILRVEGMTGTDVIFGARIRYN